MIAVMNENYARIQKRAILASDNELNLQIQRLAFGVSLSFKLLIRERRMNNNGAQFYNHLTVECRCRKHVHGVLWYKYDARAIKLGNIF